MVSKIPSMVSMELDDKEKAEMSSPSLPKYPYGLCISLCDDELEKLNLDTDEVNVGDMLHMHCLAEVTSVSKRDDSNGPCCRIELQITNIAAESEDEENEESEKSFTSKLYL